MTYRPRRLSVSAIDLYTRCPAAYHRRYVQGVVDPPTPPMAFGRAMAKALEALHRGQPADVAWVQAWAAEAQALLALGQQLRPSVQHGLALLDAYCTLGVGQGEPEQQFEVWLPDRDAVPVPLLGYMDLATPDGVWEFKTAAGGWHQGRVDGSAQTALYAYAYRQLFGQRPRYVRFVVLSTRRVALDVYEAYPAGPELRLFELRAAAVWRGVRDGVYPATCRQAYCAACVEAGVARITTTPTWEVPE